MCLQWWHITCSGSSHNFLHPTSLIINIWELSVPRFWLHRPSCCHALTHIKFCAETSAFIPVDCHCLLHLALIGSMDVSWCALIGTSHLQATYGQPWNKAHYKYELVRFWKVSLPHQQVAPATRSAVATCQGVRIYYCVWNSVKQTLTLIRLGVSLVTFARNLMSLVIWSALPSHGHIAN